MIGTAAADIGHGCIDIRITGIGASLEQGRRSHDHAALAVSALWHIQFDPGFLHRVSAILGQTLNRDDFFPGGDRVHWPLAAAGRHAIDMHSASPAL